MTTSEDPLAPLLELDGVAEAVDTARGAVDEVHRHPANRDGWAATAAEASVRAARASAAVDGADPSLPDDGTVQDPLLAGSLRVAEALGPLLSTWERAPLQALARLHVLAAADLVTDTDSLGRPDLGDRGSDRLDLLARLLTGETAVPGPVRVAVVHGELLALRPFPTANGVLARAAARLTMISTGLDSKGLIVPEVAAFRAGARYGTLADEFASGGADALRAWVLWNCQAVEAGAREAKSIADAAG